MPARSADRNVAAGPEEEEVRWIVDEATQRVDLFPIDSTRRDEHVCLTVCSLCDLCHTNNNNNNKKKKKKKGRINRRRQRLSNAMKIITH